MKKVSMFKIVVWDLLITQGLKNVCEIITLQKLIQLYRFLQRKEKGDISAPVDTHNLKTEDIELYDRMIPKAIQFLLEYTLSCIIGIACWKFL